MAKVYLSPSSQEHNTGLNGAYVEEVQCNYIADALQPELIRHGVDVMRNNPAKSFNDFIAESNAYKPDLHLPIHTNAGNGRSRGISVYCYNPKDPTKAGTIASQKIYDQLVSISPVPGRGLINGSTSLSEVAKTNAPCAYCEIDYHDNPDGARWIMANIKQIAHALLLGTLDFLGIDYVEVTDMLQKGDKGIAVGAWQDSLIEWDSKALPNFKSDQDFGGETVEWTNKFKVHVGLPQDGIVNDLTWRAMCVELRADCMVDNEALESDLAKAQKAYDSLTIQLDHVSEQLTESEAQLDAVTDAINTIIEISRPV